MNDLSRLTSSYRKRGPKSRVNVKMQKYFNGTIERACRKPLVADIHGDTANPAEMTGDDTSKFPRSMPLGYGNGLVTSTENNCSRLLWISINKKRERNYIVNLLVRFSGFLRLVGDNTGTGRSTIKK